MPDEYRQARAAAQKRYADLLVEYTASCKIEGDKVRSVGGLYVLGTERHESRRIDNQLRGRSGRQGDPGASRFYLSLEDDLMRLFAGQQVSSLMESLRVDDSLPLESRIVRNIVEQSQTRVEGANFDVRKHLLEQSFLVAEELIEQAVRDTGPLSNRGDGGAGVSLLTETFPSRFQDPLAPLLAPLLSGTSLPACWAREICTEAWRAC